MARRGLVSKGMGGPQGGGNAALMPKGDKPKGPDLIPLAEVARRLRVTQEQVESWVQKDQLRGNEKGIRPYDFKKFQLDYDEDIRRARTEALQKKVPTKSDRKPKKGFLSKMASIFGGKDEDGKQSKQLARENERLKKELQQLRKSKSSQKKDNPAQDLEEKVRFLEKQVSEARPLQAEVARLQKELSQASAPSAEPSPELLQELETTRLQLQEAQQISAHTSAQTEQLRNALQDAIRHRQELESALSQLQHQAPPQADPGQIARLQEEMVRREHAYTELKSHTEALQLENERLRATPQSSPDTELVQELLDIHRLNLERFQRTHTLYQEAVAKLQTETSSESKEELEQLRSRYQQLLSQQQENDGSQSELLGQLKQARLTLKKLKLENQQLQGQLQESNQDDSQERVLELEQQLQELKAQGGSQKLMETELLTLRKTMQAKEGQIQKIAGRLSDNEKRLAKAMQESARLTELLIERENRLRELSNEFEQEYRDKMENLDRQVSGLQWKLSLREERIASLESELLRKSE